MSSEREAKWKEVEALTAALEELKKKSAQELKAQLQSIETLKGELQAARKRFGLLLFSYGYTSMFYYWSGIELQCRKVD